MSYSTLADLIKLAPEKTLIQLTDDELLGVVNQARIDEAIAAADAEVDGYCGDYALPFSPVPPIVRNMSADMALYRLYARRVTAMPEVRKDAYNNALARLRDISKGAIRSPLRRDRTPRRRARTAARRPQHRATIAYSPGTA
jgi:phage gp36-like protein